MNLSCQVDWKEQKFQEKLTQILEIIGTDFYHILSTVSEKRKLSILDKDKGETITIVKREYPTFLGEQGSRPDIYLETNKGNIIVLELKPNEDYDEEQLKKHDKNMKKWIEEEENKGKAYQGTTLILNKDSERDDLQLGYESISWIGWDSIYKSLTELKINILDSQLRNSIDKILTETPVNKLNETLKNQLLRETEKSSLFNAIRTTVLVVELMDQLKSQMNLEEILKRYEPIKGTESHKEVTDKSRVLFNSLLKAVTKEFLVKDYSAKIEKSEYSDFITLRLKEWRGWIELDLRPLINKAQNSILLRLYMQSGPKYSLLKPLINLYHTNIQKFEEIEKTFQEKGIKWYCQFGSSPPIIVNKKNMPDIEKRALSPIYCDKKIKVYGRETDEIYTDIAELIPILVDVYQLLLD